ncbi:uncharacterized protein LTR77_005855 [Saxophila tyrrhenica]|uniref:Uncharacterized protein n=1 Tax=Saxophila tyrrhenica TaxID=1690608 RepID=A0AAV9PDQ2_9PEZI|nr:hypothetical protein LTR77_005855 [Saxophila tyrrhenica]
MRSSGVVQSLKSWASKLHPQLPLNAKESQRLLTALTSSFRQQLDQAHPIRSARKEEKPTKKEQAVPNIGHRDLHASSADSADRHLTSILTNPLLAKSYGTTKPIRDYAAAQESFLREPFQDTVTLLEEYQEHGAATVPIAALCLEKYISQLDMLSDPDRAKVVSERQAGARTLRWLWKSGLHDSEAFVDDTRLADVLLPCLVEEDHEDIVWKWLVQDIRLGPQDDSHYDILRKKKLYWYRWKGRLLRSMISAILDQQCRPTKSCDAALDAIFRAESVQANISLVPTMVILKKVFRDRTNPFRYTDCAKFDRFLRMGTAGGGDNIYAVHWMATLKQYHPTQPSGQPYLDMIREMLSEHRSVHDFSDVFLTQMRTTKHDTARREFYTRLLRTAALLEVEGLHSDAKWIASLASEWYPEWDPWTEHNLQRERRSLSNWDSVRTDGRSLSNQEPEESKATHQPVPFPTFV